MNDKKDHKEFIRIGEAAEMLEIDQQTLRRWSKKGLVPHLLRPSGQFIYKREDIENFYTQRKTILKRK